MPESQQGQAGASAARASVFLSSRQNKELNEYREWAKLEIAELQDFVVLWRFEDAPGSALRPETLYLKGVTDSDAVLFVAGDDTSDATAAELSKAVELGKEIIMLLLPSSGRSQRVTDLIQRVREVATTKDVPADEAGFRASVRDSIRFWLLTRFGAGYKSSRGTTLTNLLARSRFRTQQLWMAAGVSEPLAVELSDDNAVGNPAGVLRLDVDAPLQILVGPKGAGKTLALERLFQEALRVAEADILAPVPVYLRAADVSHSLEQAVVEASADLGSLQFNGVRLYLDALDEVDEPKAERLLQEAWILARTFPRSRVLAAGRHPAPPYLRGYEVRQPEMSAHRLRQLFERLGGDASTLRKIQSGAIAETLLRPLFAIVVATTGTHSVTNLTEDDVAEILMRNALSRSERRAAATAALQQLAVAILDSGAGAVPAVSFSEDDQDQLLSSRLVTEEDGMLRIAIRLITEHAAIGWLLKQEPSEVLRRVTSDGHGAGPWRTAIARYVRSLDDESADELLIEIARVDLSLALELAKGDKRARASRWTSEALQRTIQESDAAIASALPELYANNISEVEVIEADGDFVITRKVFDRNLNLISTITSSRWNLGARHSALLFSIDFAVDIIDVALGDHTLDVPEGRLSAETLWNEVRLLLGYGSLYQNALSVREALERLSNAPREPFYVRGDGARLFYLEPERLRCILSDLLGRGVEEMAPPFIAGDRGSGPWVWSTYSPDRLIEKRRDVVASAFAIYRQIVERWFPGLASGLRHYLLMPAVYREHIRYDGIQHPTFSCYWLPLPYGAESIADITEGDEFDFSATATEMRRAIDEHRPHVADRIPVTSKTGVLDMWSPWPARDLAYRWLHSDLRRLDLTRQLRLKD